MATRRLGHGFLSSLETKTRPGYHKWREVANAIKAAWIEELMALPVPARWKRAYARCLKVKYANNQATVVLDTSDAKGPDHMFAAAIEYGVRKGGIDMKPWLLKGQDAVNIPLMHSEEKRSSYKPTAGHSKTGINQLLTGLSPGQRSPAGMVERLQYTYRKQEHQSVTDPLARALRQTETFISATGRKSGQEGTITTFRRITKDSPASSWRWARDGRPAYRLAKKISKRMAAIAAEVLFR